eukprot:CAMPEP_0118996912 /NCGR_PEP_ID=MMETSP1173-20130426/60890_1 /TAXON_ID=1034831 /ORGANISM="Rhizochromulina marina cf, Strain CCMP1243" /LENGTH=634 /DNA_ID=CAMNT_0006948321 /DNA_START=38 /DNA_END=1938 /DNA_ORIENTATION=-
MPTERKAANHLLNFQRYTAAEVRPAVPRRRQQQQLLPSLSKEALAQSQVHVVVEAAAPLDALTVDDAVPWPAVAAVGLRVGLDDPTGAACPVTLEPLSAPLATKCAHCFSATSILRCLNFEVSTRCPLCNEPVFLEDLRPVALTLVPPAPVAKAIASFTYLRKGEAREDPPRRGPARGAQHSRYPDAGCQDADFSPRSLATPKFLQGLLHGHLAALLQEEADGQDEALRPFLVQAQGLLGAWLARADAAEAAAASSGAGPKAEAPVEPHATDRQEEPGGEAAQVVVVAAAEDEEEDEDEKADGQLVGASSTPRLHLYQSTGGQLSFLHGLNLRCLSAAGPHLPATVEARVVEVERRTLTKELRKRFQFTGHLPLGSELQFVEVDLSRILPPEVLQPFATEINQRRQAREARKRREDKARKREKQTQRRREKTFRAERLARAPPSPEQWQAQPVLGRSASERSTSLDALELEEAFSGLGRRGGAEAEEEPEAHASSVATAPPTLSQSAPSTMSFAKITGMELVENERHFPSLGPLAAEMPPAAESLSTNPPLPGPQNPSGKASAWPIASGGATLSGSAGTSPPASGFWAAPKGPQHQHTPSGTAAPRSSGSGGGGKKSKRNKGTKVVLLSSGSHR